MVIFKEGYVATQHCSLLPIADTGHSPLLPFLKQEENFLSLSNSSTLALPRCHEMKQLCFSTCPADTFRRCPHQQGCLVFFSA